MNRPWMPFYVGDYLKNTGHLSTLQHGAYLLLIIHYWEKGSLPDDDAQLARIARMTDREWKKSRAILAELFLPEWKHKRLDAEITKTGLISGKRREAANARHHGPNVVPFSGVN